MSALALAGPVARPFISRDRQILLNVAFHGLFVMNITDFCIEILTPKVCGHIYRYGNWNGEIRSIKAGAHYALRGVNQEKRLPPVDWDSAPVFSQSAEKFTIKRQESHCRILLPIPAGFKLLRVAKQEFPRSNYPDIPSGCASSSYIVKDITRVSLCQVLTYMVPDFRFLELVNSGWHPDIDWETYTANLHFWAEPPHRLSPEHAQMAYGQLSCLLPPLLLRLRVYSTVPLDRATGICGFPPEQEMGWSDWVSGGGEGVHPTNCCAVMTTH
jgi:hypothetical protein